MAFLDKPICIEFDDGKVYLESPGKNIWADVQKMSELEIEEQIKMIVSKIVDIENFTFRDGTPVTLDFLKEVANGTVEGKTIPMKWFHELIKKWGYAISGRGDEEKK